MRFQLSEASPSQPEAASDSLKHRGRERERERWRGRNGAEEGMKIKAKGGMH